MYYSLSTLIIWTITLIICLQEIGDIFEEFSMTNIYKNIGEFCTNHKLKNLFYNYKLSILNYYCI